MGLGNRVGVRHETVKTAGIDPSQFWDFQPGQRVMTVDGLPGQVEAVRDGPVQGAEDYQVRLENGLGGGTYTASQLSATRDTTASVEHTAEADYPELGSILHDRPDIAPNTVLGFKTATTPVEPERYEPWGHHIEEEPSHGGGEETYFPDWSHWGEDDHVEQNLEDQRLWGPNDYNHVLRHDPASTDDDIRGDIAEDTGRPQGGISSREVTRNRRNDFGGPERVRSAPQFEVPPELRPHRRSLNSLQADAGIMDRFRDKPLVDSTCRTCGTPIQVHPAYHINQSNTMNETPLGQCKTCYEYGHNTRQSFDPYAQHPVTERKTQRDWDAKDWERTNDSSPTYARFPGPGDAGVLDGVRKFNPKTDAPMQSQNSKRATQSQPVDCTSCSASGKMPDGQPCPMCGGLGYKAKPRTAAAEFDPYDILITAAADPSFRFHVTATWADVRRKAQRLRAEGKVNILAATGDGVAANVKGDHHVYQTALTRAPGQRTAVASWECGCKWAAYSWGRSGPWRRFEGRMCSHALALQYEAQSRGMFGRDVTEDKTTPEWLRPRTRVVVEYDRDDKRNISRPAQPRQRDVERHYRASLGTAEDQLSPLDYLLVHAAAQGEDANDVHLAVRTAGISPARTIDYDKALSFEARDKKRKHSPRTWVPGWGYGWGWCGQCSGSGCGHCAGTGLTGGPDGAEPSGDGGGSSTTTGAAINPGQSAPNEPQAVPQGPGVWKATRPRDLHENPASAGFASGRDPDNWIAPSTGNAVMGSLSGDGMEDSFEPDLDKQAAFVALAPELLGGAELAGGGAAAGEAAGAGGAGGGLLKTLGPKAVKPLVNHEIIKGTESHENANKDDSEQQAQQQPSGPPIGDDSSGFYSGAYPVHGSLGELNEHPEPALPRTDGAEDEDEDAKAAGATPTAHAVAAAGSMEEILASFQRTAGAALMSGGGAPASAEDGDISAAARAHLMGRTALKDFSAAEQAELINEGQGVTASNLDRLDITGTHYQALEDIHGSLDGDDLEDWLA